MAGTRAALYLLLALVAAGLAWSGISASDQASSNQDTRVVFCTAAPARLHGVVNAAVSLHLADPGSVPGAISVPGGQRGLSFSRWRAADGAAFLRSCDAYEAANLPAQSAGGSAGPGLGGALGTLLPVLLGALLTLAADDVKQAAGRRWAAGDEVRAGWRDFEAAVDSFIRECEAADQGLPPLDMVNATRRDLRATLRKTGSLYRRYPELTTLIDTVSGDVLGPSAFGPGWAETGKAGPARDSLDSGRSSAEALAARVERGFRLSSWRRRT